MIFKGLVKKIFGEKTKFTPPTLKETVSEMEGRYNEMVKPHLDSGNGLKRIWKC